MEGTAIQLHLRNLAKLEPDLVKPDGEARVAVTLEQANSTSDYGILITPLHREQFLRRYGRVRFQELANVYAQKEQAERQQLAKQNEERERIAWKVELERRRVGQQEREQQDLARRKKEWELRRYA